MAMLATTLLSIPQVTEITGWSVATVRRAIRSGRLRVLRPSGSPSGPIRIRPADLEAWLESCAVQRVPSTRAIGAARRASEPAAINDGEADG